MKREVNQQLNSDELYTIDFISEPGFYLRLSNLSDNDRGR